jgi:LysR family glycine cleavage system transcriptional activator
LQAVELTIRKGSIKAAAEELAITPAALGQRIKALEDYLGFDLLVRGRSGIRPTPELEAALAHLGAAFRELETVSQILDFQRVHEIHIVADTDWAELWLRPRLPQFRPTHPNTLFCINGVGDVPVRLGQSDCEIWFGDSRGEENEDELFADYLLPVSSSENTERISALPEADRLEGFPLLHLDRYTRISPAIEELAVAFVMDMSSTHLKPSTRMQVLSFAVSVSFSRCWRRVSFLYLFPNHRGSGRNSPIGPGLPSTH